MAEEQGQSKTVENTSWAAQVIDLFGGSKQMALSLDMAPSTIEKWREKGDIPEGRLKEIFDGAKRLDITLPAHPELAKGEAVTIDASSRKPDVGEDILEDELPDDGLAVGTAVVLALIAFCLAITSPLWHSLFLQKVASGDPAVTALERIEELEDKLDAAQEEIARLDKAMPDPEETPRPIRNMKSRVDSLQNQMSNVQTRTSNNQNDINNLQRRVDNLFQTGLPQTGYAAPYTYDDGAIDGTAATAAVAGMDGTDVDGTGTTDTTTVTMPPAATFVPRPMQPAQPVTVTTSGVTEASIIALRGEITDLRDRIEEVDEQADSALEELVRLTDRLAQADAREADAIDGVMQSLERERNSLIASFESSDADMQGALARTRSSLDERLVEELNSIRAERNELINALTSTISTLEDRVARAYNRSAETETALASGLAALGNKVAEVEKTRLDGHSLVIALNQLRARTQTDASFETELSAAIAVANDAPVVRQTLEGLRPFAVSGVATVDVLRERFADLAPKLIVARATGNSAGRFGGFKRSFAEIMTKRPAVSGEELPEDASFDQRVSFAEARLRKGDLQGAYDTLLQSLPQPCNAELQPDGECPPEAEQPAWVGQVLAVLSPWTTAAGQRLALDKAMADVSAAGIARASR
ncbi:MAG: hypothetical protein Alpg2KO_23510 [Alphaproteobacteria bacterium]